LVSVRSGAAESMPGMMDTVLNLGLNSETVEALARKTENRRFAVDSYQRFIKMFGNVVMHIPKKKSEEVFEEQGESIDFKIGIMIETPRAVLMADGMAEDADFFSFGTNDLTQMTYGYSRDDASKFINYYIENDILSDDPFEVLDKKGVGKLVSWAVGNGREVKSELKIGVCGEHGGEPQSIQFFCQQGLDYVSCSPFRVPIARLTAARANLKNRTSYN